jgi:trimeric autotransporter adhesin
MPRPKSTNVRQWFVLVATLTLVLLSGKALFGQTSTAVLTGTIRDSSGAILPGVTVTSTSTARNTSQSTVSNDTGSYAFPAMQPGTYSLTAELPGFKKFLREGIVLQVTQVIRLDIEMELGAISESVEVSESVPMVET